MLVLIDSDTQELIAKFVDEKLARITGRFLSETTARPLTLAISEAAKIPVARYSLGQETQHIETIQFPAN